MRYLVGLGSLVLVLVALSVLVGLLPPASAPAVGVESGIEAEGDPNAVAHEVDEVAEVPAASGASRQERAVPPDAPPEQAADPVIPPPEPHEPAAGPVEGLGQIPEGVEYALDAEDGPVPEVPFDDPCTWDAPPAVPARGDPARSAFWSAFRQPLPRVPVWDPPGPKRVGLQAGHWRVEEAPAELSGLSHGTSGGGKAEWEVNLDIARRAAAMLEAAGVEVDVLPAIIPQRYRAHAFISIHADGDLSGRLRGFKIARASFSAVPEEDDRLVEALYAAYGQATGLRRDDEHITRRMTAYYAFNSRRYCHAIAPGVPAAIVETGFLTSAADRELLIGRPDLAARGIADGALRFLGLQP